MNFLDISQTEIIAFCLILLRIGAFVTAWPILGGANVPVSSKALFSLLLTIVLFPSLKSSVGVIAADAWIQMILLGSIQLAIGFAIAFLANFFFYMISCGGNLISVSMGLSSSQLFNPSMGAQVTAFEQFYYLLAGLFFLIIKGHHIFLIGLHESFKLLPISGFSYKVEHIGSFVSLGQTAFEVGLRLSAPVLVSILLMNLALGIVGRTVPQINVLITSLPINILVGLGLLILGAPFFVDYMSEVFETSSGEMFRFIREM